MGGSLLYSCPSDTTRGSLDTDFVMPVGPDAISDGPHGRTREEITDGMANTILFGEMSDSGICWTEPRDLNVEEMSLKVNDRTAPSLRSHHPGSVHVGMADGSACSISQSIDPRILKALLTAVGGEDVPWDVVR